MPKPMPLAMLVLFAPLWLAGCASEAAPSSARGSSVPTTQPAGAAADPGGAGAANPTSAPMQPTLAPMSPTTGQTLTANCVNAVVLFVVDGSGSMSDRFGDLTRWTALRSALLDPTTGFIPRFQKAAAFGLLLYDGMVDADAQRKNSGMALAPMCMPAAMMTSAADSCPRLASVPPQIDNTSAITAMFPMREPGGATPTDKALSVAVDQMIASTNGKDPKLHPHFIILATDGEPNDICKGGKGGDGSAQKACVIAAVDRAAAANITTYVISLAGEDVELEKHLVEVAKHGNPKDPTAHTFSPMTPQDLVMTLRTVLTSALGCELQ